MSRLPRIARLFGFALATLAACSVQAQGFPSRPIRILVGFAPGGGTDTVARIYAPKLSEILKTPVLVENKPGASELLAAMPVVNAKPDGYTLWMSTASGLVRNPSVRTDIPYEPLKNLTFLSRAAEVEALYVVKPGLPVNSVPELIKFARANPGKLNYGSAGVGSSNHLLTEQLKMLTQTEMVHVPFKSDAEVAREIAGGTLDFAIAITTFTLPLVKDGKIRALGITGDQRLDALPQVPTLDESGAPEVRGLGHYLFYGLVGPAGMPADVVQKINAGMNTIAQMPEITQKLQNLQLRATTSSPVEFRAAVEKDVAKWKELGKTVKIGSF